MEPDVIPGRPGVRVLIADCTHMGSQLLAEALTRERRFTVVGCASNWDEVAASISASPEVIVLAANFERPGGGLEIPAKITAHALPAVVILLDNANDPGLVVQAFRAGARGVFSRSQSLPEMCKCIECVARGEIWATGEQINYVLEGLKRSVIPRFLNGEGMSLLSGREQEVVRYLCDGLSNRVIARALGLSEHTVKNHLLRIYAKLGVDNRVEVMFSLLSHAPSQEFPGSTPGPGSDPVRWYLQCSEYALRAQDLLGKVLQNRDAGQDDPFAAYTWLLRSERGAQDLIAKCREIRKLLSGDLTSEQRKLAETRAAQPRPRQFRSTARPAPEPDVIRLPLFLKQNS